MRESSPVISFATSLSFSDCSGPRVLPRVSTMRRRAPVCSSVAMRPSSKTGSSNRVGYRLMTTRPSRTSKNSSTVESSDSKSCSTSHPRIRIGKSRCPSAMRKITGDSDISDPSQEQPKATDNPRSIANQVLPREKLDTSAPTPAAGTRPSTRYRPSTATSSAVSSRRRGAPAWSRVNPPRSLGGAYHRNNRRPSCTDPTRFFSSLATAASTIRRSRCGRSDIAECT